MELELDPRSIIQDRFCKGMEDGTPSLSIEAAIKEKTRIICVSTSLNTTMSGVEDVLNSVRSHGLQDTIKVIVGGNTISEEYANDIGADGFAPNAAALRCHLFI